MRRARLLALAPIFLTGCAIGPNYHRPQVPAAPQYRFSQEPAGSATSIVDTKWFDLFKDDVLTNLVQTALKDNFDLRIASQRVLEARAQYGIQRSQLFPTLTASGSFNAQRTPGYKDVSFTEAGFNLSWEIDVWGRLRRLNESARAQYLASEEARRGVITTLIGDVTRNYLQLREFDLELDIANHNKQIAQDGLRLTTVRHDLGAATGLDVHQAEQFLYTATAQIALGEREIAQEEDALSLLLGKSPGEIPRGKALESFEVLPAVPAGMPSSLLERRPDIRQAEQNLVAANAEIGAARAQYFPQISLTGFLGAQSSALSNLFIGRSRQWNIAPSGTLPIFNANRIRNNVRFTEAQQRELLAAYQKSVQSGFREVSDALIGLKKNSEQRSQQELLVKALQETVRLSTLRYRGGLDSYLQVLDADRNLFAGELTLAQLRNQELGSIVDLYRALGGGWQ
jgi:multidrug efflux system outer membrane protein